MKTIHQFGDSYGAELYSKNKEYRIKNFIELSCIQLNYKYVNDARGGSSNEMILNRMLNYLKNINSGDIVFVNFSFFVRGCWYDDTYKKIKSTNELFDELYNNKMYYKIKNENVIGLVEYYLNSTKDYNMRIFTLIDSVFKYLKSKNVDIFYIFVDDCEWVDDLLTVGTNIKFPKGFAKWLIINGFGEEQECHYTKGIQPLLANVILKKTNNFTINNNSIVIDIEDVDFDVVLKKPIDKNLL